MQHLWQVTMQSTQFSPVNLSVPSLVCVMKQQWHSRTGGSQSVSPKILTRISNSLLNIQQVALGLVSLLSSKKSTLQVRIREIGNKEHTEMHQLLQSIAAARPSIAGASQETFSLQQLPHEARARPPLPQCFQLATICTLLWHNLDPMISDCCCCFSPPSINKLQAHQFN